MLVASQPSGAATWFPCNDQPGTKATYRIAITTDSPYQVVANGRLVSRSDAAASRTTWVYEQAEPMATYLATVQIGRYDDVDAGAVAGAHAAPCVPPALRPRRSTRTSAGSRR